MDNKYNESASMLTVPFTDYGLFNDERIVQMKHQQSERDHSKIKLDNILLYDLIKYWWTIHELLFAWSDLVASIFWLYSSYVLYE
jgi:hypothetical protein